jgi:hypothetical protein
MPELVPTPEITESPMPPTQVGFGTPPVTGPGAEETVEQYKSRLSGAMSALDKERNAHNATKAQYQNLEVNLRGEMEKLKADFAAIESEKLSLVEERKKLAEEKAKASAELARYNAIADKPGLLLYRELLPLTEDKAALDTALAAIEKARSVDLQRLKDQSATSQPPPVAAPAQMTKEALFRLMGEKAGTPEFDVLAKQWQVLVSQKPGG